MNLNFIFYNLFYEKNLPNMFYVCIIKIKTKTWLEKGDGPEYFCFQTISTDLTPCHLTLNVSDVAYFKLSI